MSDPSVPSTASGGARETGVLGLIPARGGSKRIPRKNVVDFHGKPIISYTIESAIRSGVMDLVHVSSDDTDIRTIAGEYGADVSLERPVSLSDDMTGLLPVARWVLQALGREGRHFHSVIILFPCAPLVTAADIRGAYSVFRSHGGAKNLLTVARSPVPAEWLYRREPDGALVPLTPGAAFIRSQDLPTAYYETGTFTIFSADFLLNTANLADDRNYVGYELPTWKAIDIDTPEELDNARATYQLRSAELAAGNSD
jgi:pseudaminic acid cytidylyltransferase